MSSLIHMDLLGLNKHLKYLLEQECIQKMKNKGFHNCSQLSVKWECQAVKLRVHLAATINMELSSRWVEQRSSREGCFAHALNPHFV